MDPAYQQVMSISAASSTCWRLAFDFELDVPDRVLTSLFSIAYLLDFAGPLSIHGTSDGAAKKYD